MQLLKAASLWHLTFLSLWNAISLVSIIPQVVTCCFSPKWRDLTLTKYSYPVCYSVRAGHVKTTYLPPHTDATTASSGAGRALQHHVVQRWPGHDSTPHLPVLSLISTPSFLIISLNEKWAKLKPHKNWWEENNKNKNILSVLPACPNFHSIKYSIKQKFTKHNEDI